MLAAQAHGVPLPLGAPVSANSNQFIAGPPAFVQHSSGQVYRADDAAPLKTEAKPAKRQDKDALDKRIQSRVEEYMAKTDKETRRSKKPNPQTNVDKLNGLNSTMRAAMRGGR